MNEIDLEELKRVELQLLKDVHDICKAQNFRYSLGGGTLLGAVRHQGFIPWDDDIDIMMPRPDYDAFIEYCTTHDVPFGIKNHQTDKSFVDFSSKVYAKNTVLEDDDVSLSEEKIGIYIDVFVIDGLGDTPKEALKAFRASSFQRELLNATAWKHYFRSKTHAWYLEPVRFALFILSRFVKADKLFEKIERRYKKIDFNAVKYAAPIGGAYREREIEPKELFVETIEMPFEGEKFRAISAYDTYLSNNYGDYMKLPPVEKQVSHHTFKAYYVD